MKSGHVWISSGQKEVGLWMVWILNGFLNLEYQPFEIRTNGSHFFQKSVNKFLDFKWSLWKLDHLKSDYQMFRDFEWSNLRSPLYHINFLSNLNSEILTCLHLIRRKSWSPRKRNLPTMKRKKLYLKYCRIVLCPYFISCLWCLSFANVIKINSHFSMAFDKFVDLF